MLLVILSARSVVQWNLYICIWLFDIPVNINVDVRELIINVSREMGYPIPPDLPPLNWDYLFAKVVDIDGEPPEGGVYHNL